MDWVRRLHCSDSILIYTCLDEYFYWCEDMGIAPVLGVWDGFALSSGPGTPITGDAFQSYIDDVLHELEVCMRPSRRLQLIGVVHQG